MNPCRVLDCVLLLSIVSCCHVSMTDPAYPAEDDSYRPMAIQTSGVSNVPAELIERLRQYQNVRAASFRGWAPDGRGILIQTRFGNTSQLHRVYSPGGRREQVTFFD